MNFLFLAIGLFIGFFIGRAVSSKPSTSTPAVDITFANLKGVSITMFIVKDDAPDTTYSVTLGEVKDAEGNVITDPQGLSLEVTSDNADVVAVTPDADPKTGNVHFGSPGQANVTANVKDANGNLLATGAAAFTVTTGDPASISSVTLGFAGLTEQP